MEMMKRLRDRFKVLVIASLLMGFWSISTAQDDNSIEAIQGAIDSFQRALKNVEIIQMLNSNDPLLKLVYLNAYLVTDPETEWEALDLTNTEPGHVNERVENAKDIAQRASLCTSAKWDEQGNAYIQGGALPSLGNHVPIQQVLDSISTINPGSGSATILIVDDFKGSDTKSAVDDFTAISHGELIFKHTVDVLKAFGFTQSNSGFEKNDFVIKLQQVEIAPDDIRGIPTILKDHPSVLSRETFVVVNMSWSIVPCAWKKKVEAKAESLPAEWEYDAAIYLLLIANENDQLCTEAFFPSASHLKTLIDPDQPDSPMTDLVCRSLILIRGLHGFVAESGLDNELQEIINDKLTYVAAAGNFGAPFPFVPAYWPFVHSVAASSHNGPGVVAEYSNRGCKIAPGGPFFYSQNTSIGYQGTSFATPIASVLYATGLANSITITSCPFIR